MMILTICYVFVVATRLSKGDATITYEEEDTASAAIKWFDGMTKFCLC
jgi:hypothetical protein